MVNLAGVELCDKEIKAELFMADIPSELVEPDPVHSEVPYSFIGRLGPFTFRRAWYYWMVDGPMPIDVANQARTWVKPIPYTKDGQSYDWVAEKDRVETALAQAVKHLEKHIEKYGEEEKP